MTNLKARTIYRVYQKTSRKFLGAKAGAKSSIWGNYISTKPKLIGIYYDHDIALSVSLAHANRYVQWEK